MSVNYVECHAVGAVDTTTAVVSAMVWLAGWRRGCREVEKRRRTVLKLSNKLEISLRYRRDEGEGNKASVAVTCKAHDTSESTGSMGCVGIST